MANKQIQSPSILILFKEKQILDVLVEGILKPSPALGDAHSAVQIS